MKKVKEAERQIEELKKELAAVREYHANALKELNELKIRYEERKSIQCHCTHLQPSLPSTTLPSQPIPYICPICQSSLCRGHVMC